MLADRVNMVEGVLADLSYGRVPNIFGEMGWKAEWKYNRKSLVTRVIVGTALASVVYAYFRNRKNKDCD